MNVSEEGVRTDAEDVLKHVKFSSLAWTHDNKVGIKRNVVPQGIASSSSVCSWHTEFSLSSVGIFSIC